MSLLDVGRACAQCSTIDFLPFTCPHCSLTFCREHVQTHGCSVIDTGFLEQGQAGPSTFKRKATCEVGGCERPSIEAIGGKEEEGLDDRGARIAKEIRCLGCNGAFCTSHRAQVAHGCTAPLAHNARQDAFLERRAKAREIIAAKFPDQKGKIIPKPPPPKDTTKTRPKSPEKLPPSLQPPLVPQNSAIDTIHAKPEVKTKTKGERMYELELRKLRSLARPLDLRLKLKPGTGSQGDGRRFFQWGLGTSEEVKGWKAGGKMDRKMDKVWVPIETPVGRILDILLVQSKTPRPSDQDPQNAYSIICLSAPPDEPRSISLVKTDRPACDIKEGSTVLLVKGSPE